MATPRIGLSMLYCLDKPFEYMVHQLSKLTMSHVELVDDGLHELNERRVNVLKQAASSFKLEYSVHSPFADLNVASLSESVFRFAQKRMMQSLKHASALEAYMWVFHSGLKGALSPFYPGKDLEKNAEMIIFLKQQADDLGVKVSLENSPEPHPFVLKNVQDFRDFYSETGIDIDLTVDVGHANISGEVEKFLTTFSDRIVHIHASDNRGKRDEHLGIGSGTIDWTKVAQTLKRISYDHAIVIESVENLEESIRNLKELFL